MLPAGRRVGDSHCSSQRPGSTISRPWVSASSPQRCSCLACTSRSRCCLRSASRSLALAHARPWGARGRRVLRHGGPLLPGSPGTPGFGPKSSSGLQAWANIQRGPQGWARARPGPHPTPCEACTRDLAAWNPGPGRPGPAMGSPPSGAAPRDLGADLGTPPTTHSAHSGHRRPPRARGWGGLVPTFSTSWEG